MAKLDIPDWVMKLLSGNGEPYRLSRGDFEKLDAFLPERFSRYMDLSRMSDPKIERYNSVMSQLMTLRNYNRTLHAAGESSTDDPPKSVEEAVKQGYVEAKVIYGLFGNRFINQSALTKYLDHADRRDRIRRFKPKGNRRMVHAADFLTVLFAEDEAELKADCKRHDEKPPRRNKTGK